MSTTVERQREIFGRAVLPSATDIVEDGESRTYRGHGQTIRVEDTGRGNDAPTNVVTIVGHTEVTTPLMPDGGQLTTRLPRRIGRTRLTVIAG